MQDLNPIFFKSLHRNKKVGVSSSQITEKLVHVPVHDNPDAILKSTFYKQGKNHKSNVSPTYLQLELVYSLQGVRQHRLVKE